MFVYALLKSCPCRQLSGQGRHGKAENSGAWTSSTGSFLTVWELHRAITKACSCETVPNSKSSFKKGDNWVSYYNRGIAVKLHNAHFTSHTWASLKLSASHCYVFRWHCFCVWFRGQKPPMTDNGWGWNAQKLLRLIKAKYGLTKTRASGGEIRSSGLQKCFILPFLVNYRLDSWCCSIRLPMGSGWSQRPCIRPCLYRWLCDRTQRQCRTCLKLLTTTPLQTV